MFNIIQEIFINIDAVRESDPTRWLSGMIAAYILAFIALVTIVAIYLDLMTAISESKICFWFSTGFKGISPKYPLSMDKLKKIKRGELFKKGDNKYKIILKHGIDKEYQKSITVYTRA